MGKKVKQKIVRRAPRKPFALELIDKLQALSVGEVSYDFMSDNSCFWVELRIKDKTLGFTFEPDQSKLCRVALFRDVVEVTDQIQIFGKS